MQNKQKYRDDKKEPHSMRSAASREVRFLIYAIVACGLYYWLVL